MVKIKDEDFKYQWYSGTGAGGQHRNKTQNCCRCIHIPTGITATGSRSRSREDNRKAARKVCEERVVKSLEKPQERYNAPPERIRTYHEPDNKVYDHATGFIYSYKDVVDDADITKPLEARRKKMLDED